jgi:hypothetical protein
VFYSYSVVSVLSFFFTCCCDHTSRAGSFAAVLSGYSLFSNAPSYFVHWCLPRFTFFVKVPCRLLVHYHRSITSFNVFYLHADSRQPLIARWSISVPFDLIRRSTHWILLLFLFSFSLSLGAALSEYISYCKISSNLIRYAFPRSFSEKFDISIFVISFLWCVYFRPPPHVRKESSLFVPSFPLFFFRRIPTAACRATLGSPYHAIGMSSLFFMKVSNIFCSFLSFVPLLYQKFSICQ